MTEKLSFQDALLDVDKLSVTWELVPGRGAKEKSQEHVLKMAELAAQDPRINSITITDNPGGKPAILAYSLAAEAQKLGIESIVHLTCKDKNRNALASELYALARADIKNLLVMTGDYPTEGYDSKPKPVFDIDSVQLIRMITTMKQSGGSNFFAGVVVSPFKLVEAEVMAQYYKLHKKITAGAQFIITQLGYDARKFDELRRFVGDSYPKVPLIGNIYVLSLPVAKLMNKNLIPGCVVTGKLVHEIEAEVDRYGKSKEPQLLRAAKLYAVLKGLGYNGINIGGHGLDYAAIQYIIETGEELSLSWCGLVKEFDYPQDGGFYFFEKDEATGLNSNSPVDLSKTRVAKSSLKFSLLTQVHNWFFDHKAPFFPVVRSAAGYIDKSGLKKPFTSMEYLTKTMTNECRFCGDCVIHELGFICPMSQCPKQQRNGACGGSRDGWCEVYPGKQKCIYVTMYETFKAAGKQERMKEKYLPPCDWELHRTSSWLNYFNNRDYSRKS